MSIHRHTHVYVCICVLNLSIGIGENVYMGHGRKQISVESKGGSSVTERDGKRGEVSREEGQVLKEVTEMPLSLELAFCTKAHEMFSRSQFLLIFCPHVYPVLRKGKQWATENIMISYKSKTESGREERLLKGKEKERMAEKVWRIEREREEWQNCKRHHLKLSKRQVG